MVSLCTTASASEQADRVRQRQQPQQCNHAAFGIAPRGRQTYCCIQSCDILGQLALQEFLGVRPTNFD
jgi:hypothetical protein